MVSDPRILHDFVCVNSAPYLLEDLLETHNKTGHEHGWFAKEPT